MMYAQIPKQYAQDQGDYDRERQQDLQREGLLGESKDQFAAAPPEQYSPSREQYAEAKEQAVAPAGQYAGPPKPFAEPPESYGTPQLEASSVPAEQYAQSQEQPAQPGAVQSEPLPPAKAHPPKGIFTMHLKHPGEDSRFEMSFADVPPDSEIENNRAYPGWCVQRTKYIRKNADHEVRLYAIDDPNRPPAAQAVDWNEINYVLNHKEGKSADVQQAIWHITDGRKQLSKDAASMVRNAEENGQDYVPGSGETTAVICDSGPYLQQTILEYHLPMQVAQAPQPVVLAETPTPIPETPPGRKWFIPPVPVPIPHGGDGDGDTPGPIPPGPTPVPEPDSLTLSLIAVMTLGSVVLLVRRRRSQR